MDIEFPENIAAAPDAPRSEIATAAADALDFQKINLTDVALAQFGNWRANVAESTKTLTGLALDLTTQAKVDDAKSLRHRLVGKPLAEARKVSKAVKSKLTSVSSEVGVELVKIEAEYATVEKLITPQIEAREAEIAEEKRVAAEVEAARKQAHEDKLTTMRGYIDQAKGRTAAQIAVGIVTVEGIELDLQAWEEYAERAVDTKAEVLAALRELQASAQAREDEAARLAEQRAEVERQRVATAAAAAALAAQQLDLAEAAALLKRQREEFEAMQRKAAEPAPAAVVEPEVAALAEQPVDVAPVEVQAVAVEIVAQDMAPAAGGVVEPIAAAAPMWRELRAEVDGLLDHLDDASLIAVLEFIKVTVLPVQKVA